MKPIKIFVTALAILSGAYNCVQAACSAVSHIAISNITPYQAQANWQSISGAQFYQVYAGTSPVINPLNTTQVQSPSLNMATLSCGVKYYIAVRVLCSANDSSAWTLDSFTTTACCYAPTPITYNPIAKTTIKVNLTPAQNAQAYEYYISPSLTLPTQNGTLTQNTTIFAQGLQMDTEYLICVRTRCVWAEPLSVWHCDTVKTAAPCDSVKGLNNAYIGGKDYVLSWTPEPFANSYEYSFGTDPNVPTSGTGTSATQVIVKDLSPNTTYYYCVRANCGTSGYYTPWFCDTLQTPIGLNVSTVENNNISISPNPAKDYVTINRPNSLTKGTVRITNLMGKVVAEQEIAKQQSRIDIADLSAGVYFIWYSDAKDNSMLKLVVE